MNNIIIFKRNHTNLRLYNFLEYLSFLFERDRLLFVINFFCQSKRIE